MKRKTDPLNFRIKNNYQEFKNNIEKFSYGLYSKNLDEKSDPTEISILPRIISREEHKNLKKICYDLTKTSFEALRDFSENKEKIKSSPINDFILEAPEKNNLYEGMARYDFLKQGEVYKLIEMNFVNVGSLRYIIDTARFIKNLFTGILEPFEFLSPLEGVKEKMQKSGRKDILMLTKNFQEGAPIFLMEELSPLHIEIVPEKDYSEIEISPGKRIIYKGKEYDTIYPRYLSGSKGKDDELIINRKFVYDLMNSGSFIFDDWRTMLLEEKDLKFLTQYDNSVKKYIPRTVDLDNIPNMKDYSDYVLKIRDLHSGRGVTVSPKELPENLEGAILQEKLFANKISVLTNHGNEGDAIYDTGVHVIYSYDKQKNQLKDFKIAGYLTRFSLTSEIVNMCRGGGLIPTLVEK